MKKVLGASIGVLAITLMSFASPQQANIKGNDYKQTVNGLDKAKPKPKPTDPKVVIDHNFERTISTTKAVQNLAQLSAALNDAMNKY